VGTNLVTSSYDAAGNLTNRVFAGGRTQSLTWDGEGRLVTVSETIGSTNVYTWMALYDALGRRTRTITTSVSGTNTVSETIDSWYDPHVEFQEVAVLVNGERTWKMYGPDVSGHYGGAQGVGGLEATIKERDGTATGIINDYYGNAVATVSSGAIIWSGTKLTGYGPAKGYRPPVLSASVPVSEATLWQDRMMDLTGFYYLGARYYDSEAGRFLSPDPKGHAASWDLYSYANGDPVNGMDPDGRIGKAVLQDRLSAYYGNAQGIVDAARPMIEGANFLNSLANPINFLTGSFEANKSLIDEGGQWVQNQLDSAAQSIGARNDNATFVLNAFLSDVAVNLTTMMVGGSEVGAASKSESFLGGLGGELSALFRSDSAAAAEGTRALTLPTTDASLSGTTTLGYTTPSGDVFLQSGLSRAEQISTLRHESVHAFFSPGDGPLVTFRQNLGQWGYENSQLLRFSEEAIAETYGSGSLLQGLRHPFVNGYGITPGGLLLEGGVVGGGLFGAGYLGYEIGGGGH
jgi:RHS repeat-associated protein